MSKNLLHIRDEGTGRPLVLIHGWSCPGQFFQTQVESLKAHARCIVPDLPGHGKTGAALPLSIEASADELHAFLEQQNLSDVILCGWSMGALVAYALIERHGADRVASMIAIDMSPKVLNTADWANGTLNGLNAELNCQFLASMIASWPKLPNRIANRLYADGHSPESSLLDFAQQEIAKADPALLKPMWSSLTKQDFRPLLSEFPVPLHLAAGLKSQLYGPGVHRWHQENVPEFQLHEFAKSGHAPHLEEPELFNRLLLDVLQR
ncbi:AB hydrolase superfamily protein YdjP [Roseibium album]|nr:AB hydrolase superfamily protein YdjP [Roseibium album]